MRGVDIKILSVEALASLRDDASRLRGEMIVAQSKELEGEIDRHRGLTSAETPARSTKAKPKYRKGADEWSGRGSQPAWVKAHF